MNILFIGASDNGGGCYFWADAINKYTNHEAVSIRWYGNYIGYPIDFSKPSIDTFKRLVKWCDVLHVRDSLPKGFMKYEKLATSKVVTFTGRWYRHNTVSAVKSMRQRGYYATVSTSDLQLYLPKKTRPLWMPNARDEMVPEEKRATFTVSHSPTYRSRKGTYSVIDACKKGDIKLDLIENQMYINAVKRKAKSHLLVDQFRFGYGNSAIEAWAMGIPVIGGALAEKYNLHHAKNMNGVLPYYKSYEDSSSILSAIKELRDDNKLYNEYRDRGYEFFFTYHHAPVVAAKLVKLYRGL